MKGLDLAQVVYPAERLAPADPGQVLMASDPLHVVLCWQLGLDSMFFVPSALSLEDVFQAIERARM